MRMSSGEAAPAYADVEPAVYLKRSSRGDVRRTQEDCRFYSYPIYTASFNNCLLHGILKICLGLPMRLLNHQYCC